MGDQQDDLRGQLAWAKREAEQAEVELAEAKRELADLHLRIKVGALVDVKAVDAAREAEAKLRAGLAVVMGVPEEMALSWGAEDLLVLVTTLRRESVDMEKMLRSINDRRLDLWRAAGVPVEGAGDLHLLGWDKLVERVATTHKEAMERLGRVSNPAKR